MKQNKDGTEKKKPGPKKGEGGAPRKEIDFARLDKLCELQCTEAEMASFFDVDVDTLYARIKEKTNLSYSEYYAQKRGIGRIALRRKQMQVAMGTAETAPNPTMLIWLGKQHLDQADKSELSGKDGGPIVIDKIKRVIIDDA